MSKLCGILFKKSISNSIINNLILNNFYGISLTDSSNENFVRDNILDRNSFHFYIDDSSLFNYILTDNQNGPPLNILIISFCGLLGLLVLGTLSRRVIKSNKVKKKHEGIRLLK